MPSEVDQNTIRVLTPCASGAIAVIEIKGPQAAAAIHSICSAGAAHREQLPVALARVKVAGQTIDDVVVVQRGDDHSEIHCHGGVAVIESIVTVLAAALGSPGMARTVLEQWRARANEPIARTLWGFEMLARAATGGISQWASEKLARKPSHAWLIEIQRNAQWMLAASERLRAFISGDIRIALVGPPNAGKSSLANIWLGHRMSITSDQPGTTRDWIEKEVNLTSGRISMAAKLTDTAGVRTTEDGLERESIRRGLDEIVGADLILLIFDASEHTDSGHFHRVALAWAREHGLGEKLQSTPWILVGNKTDLLSDADRHVPTTFNQVYISARCGTGLDELHRLAIKLLGVPVELKYPVVLGAQQLQLMQLIREHHAEAARAILCTLGKMSADIF